MRQIRNTKFEKNRFQGAGDRRQGSRRAIEIAIAIEIDIGCSNRFFDPDYDFDFDSSQVIHHSAGWSDKDKPFGVSVIRG